MDKYLENEIKSASKEKLVLYVYKHIYNNLNKNPNKSLEGLVLLIDNLNWEYDEAKNLYNLYNTMINLINKKEIELLKENIKNLMFLWEKNIVK